jgi:hypothetical protein
MFRKVLIVSLIVMGSTGYADESMQYNQKNLPNGDIETTITTSDGSKTVTTQHKDGSIDTHTTPGKQDQTQQ